MDGIKLNFHLLSEENEMLTEEKEATICEVHNVSQQKNRLSAIFVPSEELNNPTRM
jgi:hypothetical protein